MHWLRTKLEMLEITMEELGIKFKTYEITVKYWIVKLKICIKIILFILLLLIFGFGYKIIGNLFSGADSNTIGVYGALFGALIGGGISLAGSIWVSNRQLKSRAEIKRNEKIYIPLYDELIMLNNRLFKFNKYPEVIYINDDYVKGTTLPTYSEWIKIKNSTYCLEIPEILKNRMHELSEIIYDYNESFDEALIEVDNIYKTILKDYNPIYDSIQLYYSLKKFLTGDKIDFFKEYIYCPQVSKDIIRSDMQDKIEDALSENTKISVVKVNYFLLEESQMKIIKMLELIIQTTIKKYEK